MTETIPVSFSFVVTLELKDNAHRYLDILLTLYIVLYDKLKKKKSVCYMETKVRKKRIKINLK